MSNRYKDNTFHLLETFNRTSKNNTSLQLRKKAFPGQLLGKQGNTWDAKHMTNFLNKSNYSNWTSPKQSPSKNSTNNEHFRSASTGSYFFKTTKQNKNSSLIGYSKINPLVTGPQVDGQREKKISQFFKKQSPQRYPKQKMGQDGKYLFQGNSIKFRKTDPLTLNHTEIKNPSGFQKQRLLRLIHKRHPHGMTGIDHPENVQAKYYESQKSNIRIRKQANSHKSFVLDRQWKSKGKVSESYKQQFGFPHGQWILQRRFSNTNEHGYDIVTNRKIE